MKRICTTIFGLALLALAPDTHAQEPDSVIASRKALDFADKIVKANFYQDWKTYTDLTIFSAIKYYGGPDQFKEHTVACYFRNEPKQEEKIETIRITELRNLDDQWQCVIEKVRNTFINDKRAVVTSYIVGQSTDGGVNWKFVDVSHNSMENLVFIFPAIFTDLPIPQAKTIYPDEVAARQQVEEEAAKAPVKKKAAPRAH